MVHLSHGQDVFAACENNNGRALLTITGVQRALVSVLITTAACRIGDREMTSDPLLWGQRDKEGGQGRVRLFPQMSLTERLLMTCNHRNAQEVVCLQ